MPLKPLPPAEDLYSVKRVYALVDQREPDLPGPHEPYDVYFDCIDAEWVDEHASNDAMGIHQAADLPSSIIRFPTDRRNDPFDPPEKGDRRWVEIEVGDDGKLFVDHYASINHEPIKRYIKNHSYVQSDKVKQLDSLVELDAVTPAPREEIVKAFSSQRVLRGIAVYDVGQGNCNALCDEHGAPIFYFDFGGGALNNTHTYPPEIQFCYTYSPTILLSHWDWDHWASGTRHPAALNLKWVVPKQNIGINHAKFASQLLARNNLLLWPEDLHRCITPFGDVIRCSGTSRNDSGLAMLVRWDEGGDLYEALLPGDARYSDIPGAESMRLNGLVATHHGGKLRDSQLPKPKSETDSAVMYSFGGGNSFRHPKVEARVAHHKAGWRYVAETAVCDQGARGHARFPARFMPTRPCVGRADQCTLQLTKGPGLSPIKLEV